MSLLDRTTVLIDQLTQSVFVLDNLPDSDTEKPRHNFVFANTTSILLVFGLLSPIYGAVMGSYGFVSGYRSFQGQLEQIIYSALKMPLIILGTTAISIPSFLVFNTIAGLRNDLSQAIKAIWMSLASFVLIQLSLAPLVLFVYLSITSSDDAYRAAVLFNAVVFGVSAICSQLVLFRLYRELINRSLQHFWLLIAWCIVFAFVGIQLGWTFRPFIGNPQRETTFLRDDPVGNAYLELWRICQSFVIEGPY